MKTKSITAAFVCLLVFFATGCKKSSDGTTDEPVITVLSPYEGTSYTGSITLSFSLASDSGLDSCYLTFKNTSTSGVMYYNSFMAGAGVRGKTSFSFSEIITILPATLTDAQCIIKAVNLNKASVTKTINVKVKQ